MNSAVPVLAPVTSPASDLPDPWLTVVFIMACNWAVSLAVSGSAPGRGAVPWMREGTVVWPRPIEAASAATANGEPSTLPCPMVLAAATTGSVVAGTDP